MRSCPNALLLLVFSLVAGCASVRSEPPLDDRARIERALRASGELQPPRGLAHLSHTCDLRIDGERYAVVDVRELVRTAGGARGVNRIVVLSSALQQVRRVDYTDQRPLFCKGNRLYVWGSLDVDHVGAEGNVLVFSEAGRRVEVDEADIRELPIYDEASSTTSR